MLKIDFFESGIGETIVLTFPSGGIGIVDAHPSPTQTRPDILELIEGKRIHFVCLTHPHNDHGNDLPKIFQSLKPDFFWHTIDDVSRFLNTIEFTTSFATNYKDFAQDLRKGWPTFIVSLLNEVRIKGVAPKRLHDERRPFDLDGVVLTPLSPSEDIQEKWIKAYQRRLSHRNEGLPNPNLLSAILAIEYGGVVALLGSDALTPNWDTAIKHYRKQKLPRYRVLKIPHHGARNSFRSNPTGHYANYLALGDPDKEKFAVLFAGDVDHPDPAVHQANLKASSVDWFHDDNAPQVDALNLSQHPGFKATGPRKAVFHTFSISIHANGKVERERFAVPHSDP